MAKAKNKVIAGDYKGKVVAKTLGVVYIQKGVFGTLDINKENVECYELITDKQQKSAVSGVARGAVGAALLGPVGMLAGLSAKSKGIYTVAIQFKSGENCLVEVDDKLYGAIVKNCF